MKAGEDENEFLVNVELVLERMKRFRLKASKCKFGYESIEFVGHVFEKNGYRLSNERRDQILDLLVPKNIKELRRVIGLVNYFRNFVPNLSILLKPLTDLTGNKDYNWDEDCNIAWRRLKEEIANVGMLYGIEEEGELLVYTDASITGVGGILKQFRKSENREVPIIFISKKFSSVAARWSTIEQECYGIFYTLMKLKTFLLGRKFIVVTDHKNLLYLQNSNIPKLIRWRLCLLEFDFVIRHIAGEENIVADSLSRLSMMQSEGVTDEE